MIVVDTSALMAIVGHEPQLEACMAVLAPQEQVLISAATLAEALIVSARRRVAEEMKDLVDQLDLTVVPVTQASAVRAAAAYDRWGKGGHPAGLNFADCFAYELAIAQDCPLLYVGSDFARTDIRSALS